MLKRIGLAAVAWSLAVSGGLAQNQLSAAPTVIDGITAGEMMAFLQAAGMETSLIMDDEESASKAIEASVGDASVYVALRGCSGAGVSTPCTLVEPFGYFPGSGVTLAQINEFNLSKSAVSMAGLMPDGDGLIGAHLHLSGGVTPENLGYNLGLFFTDIDRLLTAISPGSLAEVSYEAPAEGALYAPIASIGADPQFRASREWRVNGVGANAPKFMNKKIEALLQGEAAKILSK